MPDHEDWREELVIGKLKDIDHKLNMLLAKLLEQSPTQTNAPIVVSMS